MWLSVYEKRLINQLYYLLKTQPHTVKSVTHVDMSTLGKQSRKRSALPVNWVSKRNRQTGEGRGHAGRRELAWGWLSSANLLLVPSLSVCLQHARSSASEMHLTGLCGSSCEVMALRRHLPTVRHWSSGFFLERLWTYMTFICLWLTLDLMMEHLFYLLTFVLARVCSGLGYAESTVPAGQRAASRHR